MRLIIAFCLVGISLSFTIRNEEEFFRDETWQVWKSLHNKIYSDSAAEKVRYTIWKDNLVRITKYNRKSKNVVLRMNHFGDMTNTEYRATVNGYLNNRKSKGSTFLAPNNAQVPDTVDWQNEGYVTPVKNQGTCGSCWAFSATGSLEGQHFKKTGELVSLSEQNLVDCSRSYGNNGCNGGLMDNAFKYIRANDGIDTEQSYPYEAKEDICRYDPSNKGADCTGSVDIATGDEDALKKAVATVGPISVAIDAGHLSFQFYHTGVYDELNCSSFLLNHGVLVVGYGTENGQDYWLVKNSWGTNWGMQGYIRMSRNKNNQCGIATRASYPLV